MRAIDPVARTRELATSYRGVRSTQSIADALEGTLDELDQQRIRAEAAEAELEAYRLQDESARIANSGRCTCTEDEACWDHEALEMRAENANGGTA
jgi:hypothetical protein